MPLSLPLRMNEVKFRIRKLDIPNTELDPDYREPVGGNKVRGLTVEVIGQIARGTEGLFRMRPTQTGNAEPSIFHAVFRPRQLEAAGLADPYFIPGDLIESVDMKGDVRPLNLVITSVRKGSGLESVGRWLLVHVDAEQRTETLGSL
jgi:hypothetical protein